MRVQSKNPKSAYLLISEAINCFVKGLQVAAEIPPDERSRTKLEWYKARLGFWQAIWATLISGGVAVAIPAAVETYKTYLENEKADKEIQLKQIESRQKYISEFLTTAIGQDIELRLRLSEYFGYLADPSDKSAWQGFRKTLNERKVEIRDVINKEEHELISLKLRDALSVDDQIRIADLERELTWLYAEIGYVRKDTNVSAPTLRSSNLPTDPAAIIADNDIVFKNATLAPDRLPQIDHLVDRIIDGRSRYEKVSEATGIPWWAIGIIHQIDAGGNFQVHLNGDPLNARTVHVPAGRPSNGSPPFSWEESAIDQISLTWNQKTDFTTPGSALFAFERYNGLGYRKRNLYSPFIWGCTNRYSRGAFVSDAVFEPEAVSKQCGAAAILLTLVDRGLVALQ